MNWFASIPWTPLLRWVALIVGVLMIWWGTRKPRPPRHDSYDWRNDGRWRSWM